MEIEVDEKSNNQQQEATENIQPLPFVTLYSSSVRLSLLVTRIVRRTYLKYRELKEQLSSSHPDERDEDRKIKLRDFANETRALYTRFLVLLYWLKLRNQNGISPLEVLQLKEKTLQIRQLFEESSTRVFRMKEFFTTKRQPIFDINSAVDIIVNGEYIRFPSCWSVRDSTIEDKDYEEVIAKLDEIIKFRIFTNLLPPQFTNIEVQNGRAICKVENEFQVEMTLDNPEAHFIILSLSIFVKSIDSDLQQNRNQELINLLNQQINQFEIFQSLQIVYDILHSLCLSLALNILHLQCIPIVEDNISETKYLYIPQQSIKLSYWTSNSQQNNEVKNLNQVNIIPIAIENENTIEIAIKQDNRNGHTDLQLAHTYYINQYQPENYITTIHLASLSLENLLDESLSRHAFSKLKQLYDDIINTNIYLSNDSKHIIKKDFQLITTRGHSIDKTCLRVQLFHSVCLDITLNQMNGCFDLRFSLPMSQDTQNLLLEKQKIINNNRFELISVLLDLKKSIIMDNIKLSMYLLEFEYYSAEITFQANPNNSNNNSNQILQRIPTHSPSESELEGPELKMYFRSHKFKDNYNILISITHNFNINFLIFCSITEKLAYKVLSINNIPIPEVHHRHNHSFLNEGYNSIKFIEFYNYSYPTTQKSVHQILLLHQIQNLTSLREIISETIKYLIRVREFFVFIKELQDKKIKINCKNEELTITNCEYIHGASIKIKLLSLRYSIEVNSWEFTTQLAQPLLILSGDFTSSSSSIQYDSDSSRWNMYYDLLNQETITKLISEIRLITKIIDLTQQWIMIKTSNNKTLMEIGNYFTLLPLTVQKIGFKFETSPSSFNTFNIALANYTFLFSPKHPLRRFLESDYKQTKNLPLLLMNVMRSTMPLQIINQALIPSSELLTRSYTLISRTSTHVRLIYNAYSVDIRFLEKNSLSIEDSSTFLFDRPSSEKNLFRELTGFNDFLLHFFAHNNFQINNNSNNNNNNNNNNAINNNVLNLNQMIFANGNMTNPTYSNLQIPHECLHKLIPSLLLYIRSLHTFDHFARLLRRLPTSRLSDLEIVEKNSRFARFGIKELAEFLILNQNFASFDLQIKPLARYEKSEPLTSEEEKIIRQYYSVVIKPPLEHLGPFLSFLVCPNFLIKTFTQVLQLHFESKIILSLDFYHNIDESFNFVVKFSSGDRQTVEFPLTYHYASPRSISYWEKYVGNRRGVGVITGENTNFLYEVIFALTNIPFNELQQARSANTIPYHQS